MAWDVYGFRDEERPHSHRQRRQKRRPVVVAKATVVASRPLAPTPSAAAIQGIGAWDVHGYPPIRDSRDLPRRRRRPVVVGKATVTTKRPGQPATTSTAVAIRGMGDPEDQLGFSFKKLIKGAIRYTNPIGLGVAVAKGAVGLARKSSIGRGIFNAVEYLPGGHELNTLVGGRGKSGGGGGAAAAAPAPKRRRAKKKIRLRSSRPPGGASEQAQAPEDEELDAGGAEDTGGGDEGGGDEGGDEGGEEGGGEGEDGDAVEGMDQLGFSFSKMVKGIGHGFAVAGKAVGKGAVSVGKVAGKVGLAVGKQALAQYLGAPVGAGQTAGQQAMQLAANPPEPLYKNPLVLAGGAAAVGGLVLLTRRRK